MGMKITQVATLMILAMLSFTEGQQSLPPLPSPGPVPVPQGAGLGSPYTGSPQAYGTTVQPHGGYQVQPGQPDLGTDSSGWPNYPYPQYHNPYYEGVSPRDMFSGTVDWFFALPSTVMDRFSGFMDRNFFPQSPAAQGSKSQPESQAPTVPQANPGTSQSLPPAGAYQPDPR